MPRKPSYAVLEETLKRVEAERNLYQMALWRSHQMDPDAVVELPEFHGPGWYRYTLYHTDGVTGGILLVTFQYPGQMDSIRPYYWPEWRQLNTLAEHDKRALEKLEVALYKRKQKRIARGEANA